MKLSEQLADAVQGAEKVPLRVGQRVEVRTHDGELVATGCIQELDPKTKVVRVTDQGSGADLQIDVDPDLYEIWVKDLPVPGSAPSPSKQPAFAVSGSKPGAFTIGKRFRILP